MRENLELNGRRALVMSGVLQHRKLAATEPLYIIGGGRVRASLAAGILTGGGCRQAVVVDGGMDAWISQGLSVVRKKGFPGFAPQHL